MDGKDDGEDDHDDPNGDSASWRPGPCRPREGSGNLEEREEEDTEYCTKPVELGQFLLDALLRIRAMDRVAIDEEGCHEARDWKIDVECLDEKRHC